MSQVHLSTVVTIWSSWRPPLKMHLVGSPVSMAASSMAQGSGGVLYFVQRWTECPSPQLCAKTCHLGPKAIILGPLQPPQEGCDLL